MFALAVPPRLTYRLTLYTACNARFKRCYHTSARITVGKTGSLIGGSPSAFGSGVIFNGGSGVLSTNCMLSVLILTRLLFPFSTFSCVLYICNIAGKIVFGKSTVLLYTRALVNLH